MKYIALYFLSITIKKKTVWWRKNDKTTVLIRLLLKVLSYLISGTIGDKYDYIVQHRLDTSDILDRMITHLVISVKDRHCIEHNKSQDEQTKALLDMVITREGTTNNVFIDVLTEYGYKELANNLKKESENKSQSSEIGMICMCV